MNIEDHIKAKQAELAKTLRGKLRVYLDINFWIALREAASGRTNEPAEQALLTLLREGVAAGTLFCPISETFFMELEKQPFSEDRRIGTARMFDELGMGVSITNKFDRVGAEIEPLLRGLVGLPRPYPLADILWTKSSYVLGLIEPPLPGIDPNVEKYFARWDADHLWDMPLTEFICTVGKDERPGERWTQHARETNEQRDLHAAEITSFKVAYEKEIRGAIDAVGRVGADVLLSFRKEMGFPEGLPPSVQSGMLENVSKNTLSIAFQKKPKETALALRTLHIEATLHAALRVDKARRFKPNDFYDFSHAAAALGYCDVFLTEGPLADLIKQRRLSDINNCVVFSTAEGAVSHLRERLGVVAQ